MALVYGNYNGQQRKTMNKQQLIFWKSEREMLDRLYQDRMRDWQRLTDLLGNDEPKNRYAG